MKKALWIASILAGIFFLASCGAKNANTQESATITPNSLKHPVKVLVLCVEPAEKINPKLSK